MPPTNRPSDAQIRQEGRVRTHSAGQTREDAQGRVVHDWKSSIFVLYETQKGVIRYRNSGISTPVRSHASEAIRDGRRLAKERGIHYDLEQTSLHNIALADVVERPVSCLSSRPAVPGGRALQLRRATQRTLPEAPESAVEAVTQAWVVLLQEFDRNSLGVQVINGAKGVVAAGGATAVNALGQLFTSFEAAELRKDELNEAFYARHPRPADFDLDVEPIFAGAEWPRHSDGARKTKISITWTDAILVGNWKDPYSVLELRDKFPED